MISHILIINLMIHEKNVVTLGHKSNFIDLFVITVIVININKI
jgi:hypothetical protein